MDNCIRCDREYCPTLPLGGPEAAARQLDQLLASMPQHLTKYQEDPTRALRTSLRNACDDCSAHLVDWRARALRAEAALSDRAAAAAELARSSDW